MLDFFAGSASMAHAVLSQNREDGGDRRFVCVQIPEPLPKPEAALKTMADVGRQRLTNAIASLAKDTQGRLVDTTRSAPEDLGFKVFKLSKPNIQPWVADENRDPDAYAERLFTYNDPLVPGWRAADVLWEVALREGFGLNTRFERKALANGNTLYEVTDPDKEPPQTFAVCLDDKVGADLSRHYDLSPDRLLVCRDVALDDTAAANLALQCRLKTI